MELRELARGLWRWTARHPDWEPRKREDDPADWAPDKLLPEHAALVPGDRLVGDRRPGLRMCPPSWLRYLDDFTQDDLRRSLSTAVGHLPIEMVLVSHGEPVLQNGHAAVRAALAR
jgi:hypothetical protein